MRNNYRFSTSWVRDHSNYANRLQLAKVSLGKIVYFTAIMSIVDDLDNWTQQGASVVEIELGKVINLRRTSQRHMNVRVTSSDYCSFLLEMLRRKTVSESTPEVHFLLGYFHQQVVNKANTCNEELSRESLTHYQRFLKGSRKDDADK